MSIAQELLAEFEQQAPVTRRFLERVPEDKLSWKPHAKSMTAGQLALHIALVPGDIVRAVQNASVPAPSFADFPEPASRDEVLRAFDESSAAARELLSRLDDSSMSETFRILAGDREMMAMSRQVFMRNIMLNHWYQHRGQLAVYLRLLDVPVPASWGHNGDEAPSLPQPAAARA
jgi:uncharacterized damage-inducible protein DinB